MNTSTQTIDLAAFRWWTIAKTEDEARVLICQTRERNAALGFATDDGLPVV